MTEPTAPPMDTDRRARYAAALATADGNDWDTIAAQYPDDAAEYRAEADAVMAVADTEQQEVREQAAVLSAELTRRAPMLNEYANEIIRLRAEVERLRTDRATVLREAADRFERECPDAAGPMDLCMCHAAGPLREWAYEAQQNSPEPESGCAHCGGDHAWDDCETYTKLVADEAQQPTPPADDYEATTGHHITCGAGFGMGCQCGNEAQQPETETPRVVAWSSVGSLFCTSCCDGHPDYRAARVTTLTRDRTCDGCGTNIPAAPAPSEDLRYSTNVCPGFPESCPTIRPVPADPPTHYGGIRCGCADIPAPSEEPTP